MPILVACDCGKRFAAQDHLFGREVSCPLCGRQFTVSTSGRHAAKGIFVTCVCGRAFHAPEEMRGQEARCRCGRPLQLSGPDPLGMAPVTKPVDSPGEINVFAVPARVETPPNEFEIPWHTLKRMGIGGGIALAVVVVITTIINHVLPLLTGR